MCSFENNEPLKNQFVRPTTSATVKGKCMVVVWRSFNFCSTSPGGAPPQSVEFQNTVKFWVYRSGGKRDALVNMKLGEEELSTCPHQISPWPARGVGVCPEILNFGNSGNIIASYMRRLCSIVGDKFSGFMGGCAIFVLTECRCRHSAGFVTTRRCLQLLAMLARPRYRGSQDRYKVLLFLFYSAKKL